MSINFSTWNRRICKRTPTWWWTRQSKLWPNTWKDHCRHWSTYPKTKPKPIICTRLGLAIPWRKRQQMTYPRSIWYRKLIGPSTKGKAHSSTTKWWWIIRRWISLATIRNPSEHKVPEATSETMNLKVSLDMISSQIRGCQASILARLGHRETLSCSIRKRNARKYKKSGAGKMKRLSSCGKREPKRGKASRRK